MNAREWLDAYAERLGVEAPTADEFSLILEIAAEAAHASERVAAPPACWLAAKAELPLERSLELARDVGSDYRES
jgi:hypothetical protein